MSRFTTIFCSVIVPSIVALVIIKLGERHKVNLLDLNSLIDTFKSIYFNLRGSTEDLQSNPKPSETPQESKEELSNQIDRKKSSPQEDIAKKDSLKVASPQKAPSNIVESNPKRLAEETKPVAKKVEVKEKSDEVKSEQSGAKPVSNLSNEAKKTTQKSAPSGSKPSDNSTPPQQNNVSGKPMEEKKKQEKEFVYTSQESQTAAVVLSTFAAESDKSLRKYLTEIKTNNELSKALKVISELKTSLPKGNKCSLTKEEEIVLEKVNQEIETIVNNCVNRQISSDNDLKLTIRESLKKVQDLETNLQQNLEQCPQPPSNFCIQTKNQLLKALKDLSSEQNKNRLLSLSNESLGKAKSNIGVCVKEDSLKIRVSLEKLHSKLSSCGQP